MDQRYHCDIRNRVAASIHGSLRHTHVVMQRWFCTTVVLRGSSSSPYINTTSGINFDKVFTQYLMTSSR